MARSSMYVTPPTDPLQEIESRVESSNKVGESGTANGTASKPWTMAAYFLCFRQRDRKNDHNDLEVVPIPSKHHPFPEDREADLLT